MGDLKVPFSNEWSYDEKAKFNSISSVDDSTFVVC